MRFLRRATRSTIALGIIAGLVIVGCGCQPAPPLPTPPGSGTTQSKMYSAMDAAYRAGFRGEAQLLATTSIAISESSLRPKARNWHPEYGYRPITDVLGVAGSPEVLSADGRQLHSDRGMWQISSRSWPQYTDAQCDAPLRAARVTFAISEGGRDFSPWDPYKAGTAQRHYDHAIDGWPAVRPVVRAFLAARP
jgi:Lysozyme like domain